MNEKNFLFDFDGTLVDSMPYFISTMLRILDENGIEYGDDIIKIITPLGYLGTAKYFKSLGIKQSEDELMHTMNSYIEEAYFYKIPAKDGVVDTLLSMREGGYSLNILTASPHTVLDPCLKRLGIFELFDNVWSCDDFETSKADPEIYKIAAKRLNIAPSQVVFVDDNINAVKTAKSAGVMAIGIYDDSSSDMVEKMREAADGYVMNFKELL